MFLKQCYLLASTLFIFILYCSFTVTIILNKQISLVSAIGYGFFGTVIKPMMAAMIKPLDSISDSDDSDTPSH